MNLHESRKFLSNLHSDHWPPGGWKEWQPLGSSQLGEYDAMMRGLQHSDFVTFFVLFRIFLKKTEQQRYMFKLFQHDSDCLKGHDQSKSRIRFDTIDYLFVIPASPG